MASHDGLSGKVLAMLGSILGRRAIALAFYECRCLIGSIPLNMALLPNLSARTRNTKTGGLNMRTHLRPIRHTRIL
jgi:hypothetical protein